MPSPNLQETGLSDIRLRPTTIGWQDLVALNRREVAFNLCLSAPWLILSIWAAHQDLLLLAIPCSVVFFMTCLRQAHDCYHGSIGVPRKWLDLIMVVLSIGMLCSTHAIRHTHLVHHRNPLGENDAEGQWARQSAWRAIVFGILFSIRIHAQALMGGSARTRRWLWGELVLIGCLCLAATWADAPTGLRYHVSAMIVCNVLVGFFAVWTVHHGCSPGGVFARTER